MTRGSWKHSPWDADPLSWFTTPNLPLAAAAIALVHGALSLTVGDQGGARPLIQYLALGIAVLSLLAVHLASRPRRGPVTLRQAIALALFASLPVVVSALGYVGEAFSIHLWWAPLAASLSMLALAPYTSAARLTIAGSIVLGVSAVSIVALVVPDDPRWPPYSTVAIALFPIVIGVIGGVVMVHAITRRLLEWNERPLSVPQPSPSASVLVAQVDAATSDRIADGRALITRVLDLGVVTRADAEEAALFAERLRMQLTSDVDRTWLERVAFGTPLRVDDEHRLADELDLAQRTALRALIDAVVTRSPSAFGSARVELRRTADGAIAVAIHIASTMPEGRRETFLAPYYVALHSTVTKLRWRGGPVTAIEFEVAGRDRSPGGAVLAVPEVGTPGGPRTTRDGHVRTQRPE